MCLMRTFGQWKPNYGFRAKLKYVTLLWEQGVEDHDQYMYFNEDHRDTHGAG